MDSIMLEDSSLMLQNAIEKFLGAMVVAAVELFSVFDTLRLLMSGGWSSQSDSSSGILKAAVSSLRYPLSSEEPPGAAS